jgi:hypothetical protein
MPVNPETPCHTPLFCVGHSHLHCVQAASAEAGVPLEVVNFWEDASALENGMQDPILKASLRSRISDHAGIVFSYIGGGAHTVIGLLSHPRRYDFVLPELPELPLDPRAEILSHAAMRASLLVHAEPYFKLMRHVKSLAARMVHMEPPPPGANGENIAPHVPWPLFPGMLQEVAPAHLRYKVWRLHSAMVAEFCDVEGIFFLPHPEAAVDSGGFLLDDYFHDGIHANKMYGELLLKQMQAAA